MRTSLGKNWTYRLGELFIWLFSSSLLFLLVRIGNLSQSQPSGWGKRMMGSYLDWLLAESSHIGNVLPAGSWRRNGTARLPIWKKRFQHSAVCYHTHTHGVLFLSRPFSAKGSKWPGMTCRRKTIDWNARKKVPHSHCVRFLKELCWWPFLDRMLPCVGTGCKACLWLLIDY